MIEYYLAKRIIVIVGCASLCSCISEEGEHVEFQHLPSEISKRIVYSENCSSILFSTNELNYFHPYILDSVQSQILGAARPLDLESNRNLYVRDISCDCSTIALAEEDVKQGKFDVVLYNRNSKKSTNITEESREDNGNALFSPISSMISFLGNSQLRIYDFKKESFREIRNPETVDFNYSIWSFNGSYIFLEDQYSNIWQYDVAEGIFALIWEAAKPFQNSRLMTPSNVDERVLYFISDHESDLNQIYRLEIDGKEQLIYHSDEDKFLLQRPISEENFIFRSSRDGEYSVKSLDANGDEKVLFPFGGVVYDLVEIPEKSFLSIWSDFKTPASMFKISDGELSNIVQSTPIQVFEKPLLDFNDNGMFNLVFLPKGRPKKWVVWLHGGPHEQTSVRHNTYINALLDMDMAVIALNYPGSTGVGNVYELRDVPEEKFLAIQLESAKRDLEQIRNKYSIDDSVQFVMVGISYGSKIAHGIAQGMESEISHLIDFSGIAESSRVKGVPILYLHGEYDYALGNPFRAELINNGTANGIAKAVVLKNEGHFVTQKRNIQVAIEEIRNFLSLDQ